ncbi:unnamed protein product, partial [Symbiodinium necroappetens]
AMQAFLFDESESAGLSDDASCSLGLRALKDWLKFDFPSEAVASIVEEGTKPVVKQHILCTRTAMDQAMCLMHEARHLKSELFTSIAKAASTGQYMIDNIKKSYGTTDAIANKKIILTEKWVEAEKDRFRHEAEEKDNAAQVAMHSAAEHVLALFRRVPDSAWAPMFSEKLAHWTELEATQMEAIKVVQARMNAGMAPEAPQDLKERVRGSATPQKGDAAKDVHEPEVHDENDQLGRGISSDRQPDDSFDEQAFHAELAMLMKSPQPPKAEVEPKPAETGVNREQNTTAEKGGVPAQMNGVDRQQSATAEKGGVPAQTINGVDRQQNMTAEKGVPAQTINGVDRQQNMTAEKGCGISVSRNPDVKTGASIPVIPVPAQVPVASSVGAVVSALNRRESSKAESQQQPTDEATALLEAVRIARNVFWMLLPTAIAAKRKATTQYKGQERYFSKKQIREKHGKLQAESLVRNKKMLQEQQGDKYPNMPHWMEHPDFRGVEDEELFLMFDEFVVQNKAKDTKSTTFATGAQLDGDMTAQIMPAMMQSGTLNPGLSAPAVPLNLGQAVNPLDAAAKGGQNKGKGSGKGRDRSLRQAASNASNKKGATKATALTQANTKIRDASSKLVDAKCWEKIMNDKTGISKAMKDGYAADMGKHLADLQAATEQLQHATLTGPKDEATLNPLIATLDKVLEGYNTFVKQVKVVFELW